MKDHAAGWCVLPTGEQRLRDLVRVQEHQLQRVEESDVLPAARLHQDVLVVVYTHRSRLSRDDQNRHGKMIESLENGVYTGCTFLRIAEMKIPG